MTRNQYPSIGIPDWDDSWEDDEDPYDELSSYGFEGSETYMCALCTLDAKLPTSVFGHPIEADRFFYRGLGENPKADENWQALCLDCASIPTLRFDDEVGFFECSHEEHDEDVRRFEFSLELSKQIRVDNFAAQCWREDFAEEVRVADESRFFSMTTLKQRAWDEKRQRIRREQAQRLKEAKERGDRRFGSSPIL